jgi:hypothetical protein
MILVISEGKETYKEELEKSRKPKEKSNEEPSKEKNDQVDLTTDPRWAKRKKELGGSKPLDPTR